MYGTKEDWERACNEALAAWQNEPGSDAYGPFFSILVKAPLNYRFLSLDLFFTAKDVVNLEQHIQIETLGITPQISEDGRSYSFPVIAPRVHDWTKSGFDDFQMTHRGSYVRDHHAEYPDLESMRYEYCWPDKVTKKNGMVCVHPRASPIGDRVHFYPRNLRGLALTKDSPKYLTNEELAGVEFWYERELK